MERWRMDEGASPAPDGDKSAAVEATWWRVLLVMGEVRWRREEARREDASLDIIVATSSVGRWYFENLLWRCRVSLRVYLS